MADRAKYVGPHLEVVVDDPKTDDEPVKVKRLGLLPADVAASTRDELLKRTEDWTAVKDPAGSAKKED